MCSGQARKENADKTRKYKQQFEEKLEALTEKSNKQVILRLNNVVAVSCQGSISHP